MDKYGPNQTFLDKFGPNWTRIWTNLDKFLQILPILDKLFQEELSKTLKTKKVDLGEEQLTFRA